MAAVAWGISVILGLALPVLVVLAVRGRRFTQRVPARGRTVAIVPVGAGDGLRVRATVLALAAQTIPPDEIHVMDDGLALPVESFSQPTVTWHWQPRQGKRRAQANLLRQFAACDWDFVLTVDVASPPAPDALENLLRSISGEVLGASRFGSHELIRAGLVYRGDGIEPALDAESRRAVPLLVSIIGRRPTRVAVTSPHAARERVGAA